MRLLGQVAHEVDGLALLQCGHYGSALKIILAQHDRRLLRLGTLGSERGWRNELLGLDGQVACIATRWTSDLASLAADDHGNVGHVEAHLAKGLLLEQEEIREIVELDQVPHSTSPPIRR